VFCPSCGARCAADAIACHACGAILPGLTDALANLGVPSRAPGPPVAPPPTNNFSAVAAPVVTQSPLRQPEFTPYDGHEVARPSPQRAPAPAPAPAAGAPPDVAWVLPSDGRLIGRIKLVVEQGKILGEQFLLADHDVTIGRYDAGTGRCPDIDLTAQDPAYVHRQHARLTFTPDGKHMTLHDMGGRNGSYVNNQLLDKNGQAPVRVGDKVRIGRVVMRVQPVSDADKDPQRK